MTVTTNGAAASNSPSSNVAAGTPTTFNYTAPAGTDCLVLVEGSTLISSGNASAGPTAVSYDGVAMTMVPGSLSLNGPDETTIWTLTAAQGLCDRCIWGRLGYLSLRAGVASDDS
jgi:hypothetical protein